MATRKSLMPRWALRLLAGSPLGATEAIMLAHGFTNAMLDPLVREGLATAERRAVRAGRQPIQVTWFAITERGGRCLLDDVDRSCVAQSSVTEVLER
jgi:hypothetical protein